MVGVHSQLFQAQKRVAIALCGKGNIGSSWLALFAEQKAELEKRRGMSFDLVAVVDSQTYWLDLNGIDPTQALARFEDESVSNDGQAWLNTLAHQTDYHEVVVMDVTASAELARQYEVIAEHGMHLICANKVAGSASTQDYQRVVNAFDKTGRHWLYNATVGAGLPVNYAIRGIYAIVATKLPPYRVFSQVHYLGCSNNSMVQYRSLI